MIHAIKDKAKPLMFDKFSCISYMYHVINNHITNPHMKYVKVITSGIVVNFYRL